MQSAIPFLKIFKRTRIKRKKTIITIYKICYCFIAAVQGYGVSIGLESMQTTYGNIVFEPGLFFRLQQ